MTAADWHVCADPTVMLAFLRKRRRLSERKARLFAVACCRRIWHLLTAEAARTAVEVAERYADGAASPDELYAAHHLSAQGIPAQLFLSDAGSSLAAVGLATGRADAYNQQQRREQKRLELQRLATEAAAYCRMAATSGPDAGSRHTNRRSLRTFAKEARCQADLLRCLFGNPFLAPPPIDSAWVEWTEGTVRRIAETIYGDRAFEQLPILSDALEDAGCSDETILSHLRSPTQHFKGCWALDALLGRERRP